MGSSIPSITRIGQLVYGDVELVRNALERLVDPFVRPDLQREIVGVAGIGDERVVMPCIVAANERPSWPVAGVAARAVRQVAVEVDCNVGFHFAVYD